MNGFTVRIAIPSLILLLITSAASLTFAANLTKLKSQLTTNSSKAGCMMCHDNQSMKSNLMSKNNDINLKHRLQNRSIKTS